MSISTNPLKHKCCKVCRHCVDNNCHGGHGQQRIDDEDWSSSFGRGIVVAESDGQKENVTKVESVGVAPRLMLVCRRGDTSIRWKVNAPMNQKTKNTDRPIPTRLRLDRLSRRHSSSRSLINSSCKVKLRSNRGGSVGFLRAQSRNFSFFFWSFLWAYFRRRARSARS